MPIFSENEVITSNGNSCETSSPSEALDISIDHGTQVFAELPAQKVVENVCEADESVVSPIVNIHPIE